MFIYGMILRCTGTMKSGLSHDQYSRSDIHCRIAIDLSNDGKLIHSLTLLGIILITIIVDCNTIKKYSNKTLLYFLLR